MGSGRVPGAGRTGKISFKDQRRKRILGGQGLGISGLEHAAAPFLVALSPWSSLLQASRVTFLNHIWPSHSPPLTLPCPYHPWDKIQVSKDSQHSRPNKQLFLSRPASLPIKTVGCTWLCRVCSHLQVFAQVGPSAWVALPDLAHSSSFFKTLLKCPLLPPVFPGPEETLNCSIFWGRKCVTFPSLAPENFDLKYHVWFIWVS